MLEKAVVSPGISEWFDELLSVDVLKCYKPTPAVYQLVTERFDCAPRDVTFFSSNNWDVSGAGAAWDKLPGSPDRIVTAIAEGTKSAAH
jgi:2-haloacid dehalogenase